MSPKRTLLDVIVNLFGGLDTVIFLPMSVPEFESVDCTGDVHDEILLALEAISSPG